MTPVIQWIAAILGVGGGGKFLFDVLTARSQNKKNKTDNAVTLVNSAAGYAEGLVKRIDTLQERSDRVSDKFDEFRREQRRKDEENERRERERERLLMAHSRWDHQVVQALAANGIQLDEPPPLFMTEREAGR